MSCLFPRDVNGWKRTRLRYCVEAPKNGAWGGEPGSDEKDVVCVRVADFVWDNLSVSLENPTIRSITLDQFKRLALRRGDLLLEKSGGGEKSPVGRVVRFDSDVEAITSNFVARVRPNAAITSAYLGYLWAALYLSGWSHQFIKQNTGIQNLDDSALLDTQILIPDLPTQQAIADFLDRETARIDQLIEKKVRLLSLLEEKRTAVITAAVTGRIGPGSSQHTNSDVLSNRSSWYGSLPNGWTSRRIKTISPVMRGASPRPIDDPVYFDDTGEYAWVRISDVSASNGVLQETTQRLSDLGASKSVKLQLGELFLSIAGSVGKPCITGVKACIHDGFVYFPYLPNPSKRFLYWIFESRSCFAGLGKLGTQLNLNTEIVGNIEIPFPSLDLQMEISRFLDRQEERNRQLTSKTELSISRLGELRAALITAAVTGQIDVATWGKRGETDRRLEAIERELEAEQKEAAP